MKLVVPAMVVLAMFASCKNQRQAEVDGIWIAQADGLSAAPEGATLPVRPGEPVEALPDAEHIRLAIAREVLWKDVRALSERIRSQGKTPYLLVASDRKVGSIDLDEELDEYFIEVFVTTEGKLCVRPPGSREAKCVQRPDRKHVDRAFTRELVREAVGAYKLTSVLVEAPPDLEWADLVRAVDGARTCCFEKKIRVRVKN